MDVNVSLIVMKLLLVTLLPVTGIVLTVSIVGTLIGRALNFHDGTLQYVLRFLSVVAIVAFFGVGMKGFVVEESRKLLMYGEI